MTNLDSNKLNGLDLKNLPDLVPGMIIVYNIHTGEYVYVNKAIEKLLGYTPDDFLDKGLAFVTSLIHPDDLDLIMTQNQAAMTKANEATPGLNDPDPIVTFEYRMRHAEGHYVWLHTDGRVYDRMSDGQINHVLNISIDITERKLNEDKLHEMRERLETIAEDRTKTLQLALKASSMGIWEWNIRTGDLIWSDELKVLFGLRPSDQITYQKYIGILHPNDRSYIRRVIQKAMRDGKPYGTEHRVVWPDGSTHWVMGQGQAFLEKNKPVRMIGTSMNIDERKRTQAALEESQIRFKTLFDSNAIGITIPDLTGKIHEANDTFLKMVGYSRSDLKAGKVRWDTMTPSLYRKFEKEKIRELRTKGEATPWEKEYIRKDGERVPVLIGIVQIPHTAGLGVAFIIDITERKQLMELNKAKDEFISIASHQLRTPATSVKQYIGMLQQGYAGELTPDQRLFVDNAYESNERQLNIVSDLLQVARIDAGKLQLSKTTTDLVDLVRRVIEDHSARTSTRQQSIILKADSPELIVPLDRDTIRMVMENLLDNASKYSSEKTQITVTVRKIGNYAAFQVKDTGVGIAQEDFDKLYQKFSRIDNPLSAAAGGSGLGLYWVKQVIDLHGGSIGLKSEINKGTSFTVKLPLADYNNPKTK